MVTTGRRTDRTLVMRIVWCSVIFILNAFGDGRAQSVCPNRCLCYLDREPSSVICAKQGLQEFPANLSDLIQHLDLSGNLLQEIPDEINQLTELVYLFLPRNRLTALPESLQGLEKLQRLDLSGNNIRNVASIISLRHLSRLKILYLAGNPLPGLEGLENYSLQALDAGRCAIREIDNASFIGLPSMTTLSLSGNPLRLVKKPKSDVLRWLDMSDCQINYLNPDTFEDMPELTDLRMANNPTLVYSTRYETLTHTGLQRLDVSRCNLDRPGLHGLPFLTHVKLSRNLIRILPDRIFAKNKELVQISLSANGLDQLNRSSFVGLIKLESLDLSSNALQEVHWASFRENINLRLLNLSYNTLFDFPNLTTAATVLDMSANIIYKFKNNVLLNMPRLKTLNLNNNRLEFVPNKLESQSLKTLYLRQNRLVQLANESLALLPALEKIDLSGNRLTEAPDPEIFLTTPNLQMIDLYDNPWRCDCHQLYASFAYLTEPPAKTIPSNLICQSPSNVSGFLWENACYETWSGPVFDAKDRAWGLVLVSLLVMVIVFGSVVSLRHAMKMKRQALLERQELERTEARERLRLLQRRNQRLEEELMEQNEDPRIHPMELIGPPSYEEAVHMPRLAHSMDGLDAISMDSVPTNALGSVDNLRSKKRRTRRPRKRAQSEENLARREGRREERRRRSFGRNHSAGNLVDSARTPESNNELESARNVSTQRPRLRCESDAGESNRGRPRPQTPAARVKKRRQTIRNGHSSDDEDSEAHNGLSFTKSSGSIVIQNLPREPRSGYRPMAQESGF